MNRWITPITRFVNASPGRASIAVGIVSFLLFSLNIQGLSIYALDEAKNAECAREMYEQGEWIVPTFNYELRGDKPPLHYYFMMLGFELFGVNEWGARFFGALAGAILLLFVFRYSDKYLNRKTAWLSAGILWASLHLNLQYHMAVPDPYLVAWFGLTLLFFHEYLAEQKLWALLAFYSMMALGVLTKGPIAIALPGLIMLLHLVFTRQLNGPTLLALKPWWGTVIVLGISLPWFILVHQATGGAWTDEFFFKHNLRRFSEPLEGHGGIFLLTFAFVFGGMLPFSVFLPQAFRRAWLDRPSSQFLNLCFWAAVAIIGFFAISSTKLPNYTVPAYPFLAILLAYYLTRTNSFSQTDKVSYLVYLILAFALPIGAYFGLKADPILADLAYLGFGLILIPIGAILGWFLGVKSSNKPRFYTLLTSSWVLTAIIFFYLLFPPIDQRNPVLQTQAIWQPDPPIVQYQLINRAFNFYLRKPIPVIQEEEELLPYFQEHPDHLLIIRKAYWEKLDSVPPMRILAETPDLFEKHTTLILTLDKSAKLP